MAIDRIGDSIVLDIPGGRPLKVLFDERTHLYADSKRLSILDLHIADHASIETRLDGSAIFAVRVHILSSPPDGEVRGQVASFQAGSSELKLHVADGRDLITLRVPIETEFARPKSNDFVPLAAGRLDLVRGTLVKVSFRSDNLGRGYTTHVDILAVPGSTATHQGNLLSLDLRSGRMTITAETSTIPEDVFFDPSRFPQSKDLRVGMPVRVRAVFDGNHFNATEITPD